MTARRDGAVVVLPSTARPPRWHGTFVAIAGPAANLVSGALALLIALTASTNSILESYGLLALFGSMSMAVAIINLIPFRLGQYYSDGARCLQDMSNSPLSDFRRVIRSVMAVGESPLRPRDYDLEAIDGALKGFGAGMEGHYLKLYAFDSYFDQGKIAEAAKVLAEAEAIYDSLGLKAETEISFVLGYAGLLEDPVAARRWWERLEARNPDRSQAGYWLAKCALEYAEGHREDAIAALHHADTLVAELPPTGSQAYDIEWSARLHGQVEKISEAACAATA